MTVGLLLRGYDAIFDTTVFPGVWATCYLMVPATVSTVSNAARFSGIIGERASHTV